jgi:toxin YoeB
MEVIFTPEAIQDLQYWKKSGNKSVKDKITKLIDSICTNPFEGIGKPEPLQYNLSGKWSRRINNEHRLIYSCDDKIHIYSLRGHYGK